MKQICIWLVVILLLSACGTASNTKDELEPSQISQAEPLDFPLVQDAESEETQTEPNLGADASEEEEMLKIQIGDIALMAILENNPSVEALKKLLSDGQITIDVQNYGNFEKVGMLPQSIPKDDVQITAVPGDVMLYQGNSIVFFYGSNTWSYTKLGTITGVTQEELKEILAGKGNSMELSIVCTNESDETE